MIPIQLSIADTAAGVAFLAGAVASIVVGLFVGYRAFDAYRQTGSRRLLLFGVGLVSLVALSKLLNILLATSSAPSTFVGPVSELVRLAGATILTLTIYDR